MDRSSLRALAAAIALVILAAPALAVTRGRAFDPEKRFRLNATFGQVAPIDGFVQETTRPIFEITGQTERNSSAESYSFDEIGLEESDTTYGLALEYMWKYVTLQFDGSFATFTAQGTAFRDFFIGVQEVRFAGQPYEYQVILEGTPYTADLDAALLGLRAQITPVTFNAGGAVQMVPWAQVGLFGFTGQMEVAAGPALGVQLYENPARQYVQNGRSTGDVVAFVPEVGIGGELRFRLGRPGNGGPDLVLQAGYSIFEFEGSTGDLGISARNEKDVDVNYDSYEARALIEWPVSAGTSLVAGAELRTISADALSSAQQRSPEEVEALREKFDKNIDLEMTSVNAILGLRW